MGRVPKSVTIANLQQRLSHKLAVYEQLAEQNQVLRRQEEVLVRQVTQQGDNLHFVALAACQADVEHGQDVPQLAKTLLQDLQIQQLLEQVGSTTSAQGQEPSTTQWLRRAVTTERVAHMQQASVEQVAEELKQLTMRMCMLLAAGPRKAALLSDSLEQVVEEYGEYGMLLHAAADRINLQIGTLNLDTLQEQEAPPGYWEQVADALELRPEQQQHLATGFETYHAKSRPIVMSLHEIVASIRSITEVEPTSEGSTHSDAGGERGGPRQQHSGAGPSRSSLGSELPGCSVSPAGEQPQPASNAGMQQHGMPGAADVSQQPCCDDVEMLAAEAAEDAGSEGCSSNTRCAGSGSAPDAYKPWQQFGLASRLTAESAEQLEQLMAELLNNVFKLREMHRTVTFLWLNTLDCRQHAVSITESWPWWSRPLTMCQYIAGKLAANSKSASAAATPACSQ